jgi:hypothetical protein
VGAAVLAVRFAAVAVQTVWAETPSGADDDATRSSGSAAPHRRSGPDDGPDAAPMAPPAESVRMTLSVLVGGDRAGVYINGRRVGLTPFVGDVPCKRRSRLKIEVVPREGPAQTYVRRCRGGVERITQPDPPGVEMP